MLLYFSIALALALLTHLYLDRRLLTPAALPDSVRQVARRGLWLHALLMPAAMVACLRAPAAWALFSVPVGRVVFFDVGLCLMLVCCVFACDLLLFGMACLRGSRARLEPGVGLTRRTWFRQSLNPVVLLAAAGQTGIGCVQAHRLPEVRRVMIPLPAGAAELSGLRIVHLSDVHIGPTLRGDYLEAIVARINRLTPDLVAITGDLVDGFVEQLAAQVAALGQLRAPLGCYFVTGNHEYFYRAEEWVLAIRALGISVLLNDSRTLTYRGAILHLSGVCDESATAILPSHRPDLLRSAAALASIPPHAAALRVLLAHRPHCAPRAAALGFDVQLSGHMHAGQFFPLTWLLRALSPYVAGLYRIKGLTLYVNRGAGYWGPTLRLFTPNEIALLEFTERTA